MDLVLVAVLPIFALILSGYLCGRSGILGPAATDALNGFVVWLALPALLFDAMARLHADVLAQGGFVAAFGGGMVLTYALCFRWGSAQDARLADRGIDGLSAAYANTGFLGIPLALALFGTEALAPAIVASLLTVCALFGFSIILIERDLQGGEGSGARKRRAVAAKVVWLLLRNPLLVSPVLGLAYGLTGWPLPVAAARFATLLGGAASPCALVTIGLFLAQKQDGSDPAVVARLVGLKLVVQPALTGLLAFKLFAMPPMHAHVALLLSALPTGTGPFMLAKLYHRNAAETSRAILLSTLLSLLTVSVLVAWFGRL